MKIGNDEILFTDKTVVLKKKNQYTELVLSKVTCIAFEKRSDWKIVFYGIILAVLAAAGTGVAVQDQSDIRESAPATVGILVFVASIVFYFITTTRGLSIKTPNGEILISGSIKQEVIDEVTAEIKKRI